MSIVTTAVRVGIARVRSTTPRKEPTDRALPGNPPAPPLTQGVTIHFYDPNGNPISQEEWMELFQARYETANVSESWWRKQTKVSEDVTVSTVWIGVGVTFDPEDAPANWETMIFGSDLDGQQFLHSTRGEAYDHHEELVRFLRTVDKGKQRNGP